jgi:hypothetical protein
MASAQRDSEIYESIQATTIYRSQGRQSYATTTSAATTRSCSSQPPTTSEKRLGQNQSMDEWPRIAYPNRPRGAFRWLYPVAQVICVNFKKMLTLFDFFYSDLFSHT